MGRTWSTNGDERNAYILVVKSKRKRSLERLKRWWVDNMKTDV
jgi:hypothetical protein